MSKKWTRLTAAEKKKIQQKIKWKYACDNYALLTCRDWDMSLIQTDKIIAENIIRMAKENRAVIENSLNPIMDILVNTWMIDRRSMISGYPTKCPTLKMPIEGTNFELNLHRSYEVTVDIVANGGRLTGDEIQIDGVLPLSTLNAAKGKRADEIFDNSLGLFNGSRIIKKAHVRLKKTTVFKLSECECTHVQYEMLLGDPRLRKF